MKQSFEKTIDGFFESVETLLSENINDNNSAEIERNIKCVNEIRRRPHLHTRYMSRMRLAINPTNCGFVCYNRDVYAKFIAVLNAIDEFYNSDKQNKNATLLNEIRKWNTAIAPNAVKKFVSRALSPRVLVRSKMVNAR